MGLLYALIKNSNSREMNRSMIGYEIEDSAGPIGHEEIIAYARATKDDVEKYAGSNCVAPPFFGSKLVFNSIKKIISHNNLKLNLLKMVHGQQEITWHKDLRPGDIVKMKLCIKDIYEVPIGEMVEISAQAYVGNQLAVEAISGMLVKGKKAGRRPVAQYDTSGYIKGSEVFTVSINTSAGQQLDYARASGDTNFIHTNTILAKAAGLPGMIMHGICVLAMCNNSLAKKCFNGDYSRLVQVKGRFSSPVLPNQKLQLVAYNSNKKNHYLFEAYNEKSKPVIKNGVFVHK